LLFLSCDTRKTKVYDKIVIEKQKQRLRERENMEIKETFLNMNLHLKDFWDGIRSLLEQADARGSADIIYRL